MEMVPIRNTRSVVRSILIAVSVGAAALLALAAAAWTSLPVADDPLLRMPGTQPGQVALEDPNRCQNCHSGYDHAVEPGFNWQGSMMAQAARDPLMWACLAVSAQDSIWAIGRPNATDLCLRCHLPEGWLEGRSDPTNGTLMAGSDFDGVHCDLCHRLVDPFFETTHDGTREGADWAGYWDETNDSTTPSQAAADVTYVSDQAVAATIDLFNGDPFYGADNEPHSAAYTEAAGGQFFVDVDNAKRASFADAEASHTTLYSRFHKSRYLCAACHDVSNPVLANLAFDGTAPGDGTTVLPSEEDPTFALVHVERTFSEFMLSDYGLQGGAPGSGPFAPGVFETSLANNYIARCQDCHMADTSGKACNKSYGVLRPSGSIEHPESGLPHHDLTGGNAWVGWILASTVPTSPNYDPVNESLLAGRASELTMDLAAGLGLDPAALLAGSDRATTNLQRAASIDNTTYNPATGSLSFRIQNHTGHKLISGFPEGRRMFVNIVASLDGTVVWQANPYDATADTLKGLPGSAGSPALAAGEAYIDALVYEMHPSSTLTGESKTFHFALADGRSKDNRIPPRGFRIGEAAARQCEPVWEGAVAPGYFTTAEYAGGYDEVAVTIPEVADEVVVTLYYQTTSREYIEFLRDEINGTGATLPPEAYVASSDPFFDALRAWGDTIWQLWDHNRDVPGSAPIVMAQSSLVADSTIVVEKQTAPDGASQLFSFSGDAEGTIADGQQIVVSGLWPGTYTSTETVPAGWELASIICDDGESSGETETATATYVVGAGETVTCVFTNSSACAPLVLSGETVTTTELYRGCPSVTAGPAFTIASPGDVTFEAGQWIALRNGFAVQTGAAFTATIDPSLLPP